MFLEVCKILRYLMILTEVQKRAIAFALEKKKVALALDTSVGKTAIGTAILAATTGSKLIISTPLILKEVWQGSDAQMISIFQLKKNVDKVFDVIIVDEATRVSGKGSAIHKAALTLCKKAKYVVLLTGSLHGRDGWNVWAMIKLLDGGERLGNTQFKFAEKYLKLMPYGRFVYRLQDGAAARIATAIQDIVYYADNSHVPDMPDFMTTELLFSLSARQVFLLKALQKGVITVGKHTIIASSVVKKSNLKQQILSGFVMDQNSVVFLKDNPKLNMLIALHRKSKRMIITFRYIYERKILKTHFPQAVNIGDEGAVEGWNNGTIDIILVNVYGEVYGLNLQFGGNVIVWYANVCSYERFAQLNARLIRRGQSQLVKIFCLLPLGSASKGLAKNKKYSLEFLKKLDESQKGISSSGIPS